MFVRCKFCNKFHLNTADFKKIKKLIPCLVVCHGTECQQVYIPLNGVLCLFSVSILNLVLSTLESELYSGRSFSFV